jgi:hypothetical protein
MQNNNLDISGLVHSINEDDEELMDADQFKAVVTGMKLTSVPVVHAAYYVLVKGYKVSEAVDRYGVSQNHLSNVLGDIRTNIFDVADKAGGAYRALVLSEKEYQLAKALQDDRLKPMLDRNRERWEKYGLDEEFGAD